MKLETPGGETRILLHSCCAPCSGAILECMVQNGLRPCVFFSNSNIVPRKEYELRRAELERYCHQLGLETVNDDYDHQDWLSCVLGNDPLRQRQLAAMPERQERCLNCFRYRLLRAAHYAQNHGFQLLTTSLASSRWKDLEQVNEAGVWACRMVAAGTKAVSGNAETAAVRFWEMNWRKGGLQPRRSEIIKEQCFYNQLFCGCEFSKIEE